MSVCQVNRGHFRSFALLNLKWSMGRGLRIPRTRSLAYARVESFFRQAESEGSSVGVRHIKPGLDLMCLIGFRIF